MAIELSPLASGSSGNSQLIRTKTTNILLDAGMSGKYICGALSNYDVDIKDIDGILVTHEHSDHISGLGIMHRKANIPIYINQNTWLSVKDKIGKINEEKVVIINNHQSFAIKDLVINPHPVSHDAVDPLCFSFEEGNNKVAIVTDLGIVTPELIDHIKSASLIMLEANHNEEMLMMGKYPYPLKRRVASDHGHLSNETCANAAIEAISEGATSTIVLAHLSRENNTPELAYESVRASFLESGITVGKDVMLDLAYRNRVGNLYRIDR